jgi:hypothetical protein
MNELETGQEMGDFRIVRRIGSGGMGIVYEARQLSLDRPVALKILGPSLTRSADLERFAREAQAAARLKHPGIATVYYVGQDRELCYLAMELIRGQSLRQVLDRLAQAAGDSITLDSVISDPTPPEDAARPLRFDLETETFASLAPGNESAAGSGGRPLPPAVRRLRADPRHVRRACELVRDAAQALGHAHERHVVHRDVKPENLLVDQDGEIHLVDFGVARVHGDLSLTRTGQIVGTPLYMSPEQVLGRGEIDARSDVYSLGLVLYELLALRLPMAGQDRETLLRRIVTRPMPPIRWSNASVPEPLEAIVHRATSKDPDDRYSSALEMGADLTTYLEGRPVAAPSYRYPLDMSELVAARPAAVMLAAFIAAIPAVGLCLVALILFCVWSVAGGFPMPWRLAACLVFGLSLAGGIGVARGLLTGRRWGWFLAGFESAFVGLAGLALVISAGILVVSLISPAPTAGEDSMDGQLGDRLMLGATSILFVPAILLVASSATMAILLLRHDVRAWFRSASQFRKEHARLRIALEAGEGCG